MGQPTKTDDAPGLTSGTFLMSCWLRVEVKEEEQVQEVEEVEDIQGVQEVQEVQGLRFYLLWMASKFAHCCLFFF